MIDDGKCIICDEAITNPVCASCLDLEVMHWIIEIKPSLVPLLRQVGESVAAFTDDGSTCILCNHVMGVCPHCYCKEIFYWLYDSGYQKIAYQFRYLFNFELDHYCHDADWIPKNMQNLGGVY